MPDWIKSKMDICNVIIDKGKNIEDCENMLQVDFANSYLGGGVLRAVCYIYIYIYIFFFFLYIQ